MATQTPGKATPNPKYKTYKRGEGGSISGSAGTSTPKAATGGNIGGKFDTGVPGYTGYASGAVEQIKTGEAEAQGGTVLYSKTYKGGSGTTTTPTGQQVNIQQQQETSYSNVKKAREEAIATSPKLSEQQTKELYNKLQRDAQRKTRDENREIIKKQIEEQTTQGQRFKSLDYNKETKKFTINTESGRTETTSGNLGASSQTTQFYAPRNVTLSETTTPEQKEIFTELDTTDWITPNLSPSQVKQPFYASFEGQTSAIEAARIKTINYLTLNGQVKENYYSPVDLGISAGFEIVEGSVVLGISAGFGIVEGSIGATQFLISLPKTIKENKAATPLVVGEGIIQGMSEATKETAKNIATKNIAGITSTAGQFYAQGTIFGTITETISPRAIIKRQADFAKDITWQSATRAKEPYTFQNEVFDTKEMLIPPEYTEALGNKELQPKPETTLEPIETTPGYWLEVSKELPLKQGLKQAPELQAKLGIEIKAPEQSFTAEQLLEINKQTTQKNLLEIFNKKGQQQISPLDFGRITEDIANKYAKYKTIITENRVAIAKEITPERTFLPVNINLVNQNKPGFITRVNPYLINSQTQSPINRIQYELNLKQNQAQSQDLTQTLALHLIQGQTQSQAQQQAQQQQQAQIQTPKLEITPQQAQRIQPRTRTIQEQTTNKIFTPFKPNKKETQQYKQSETFTTEVRKRGKFQTISTSKNLFEAVESGLKRTRTTAAASFKVRGSKGELINLNQLPSDFTKSKKETGVYIQRREKRISTSGEKSEITNKGIFANKNLKGRVNKWEF